MPVRQANVGHTVIRRRLHALVISGTTAKNSLFIDDSLTNVPDMVQVSYGWCCGCLIPGQDITPIVFNWH
jgi:hypothetical protein